MLQDEYCHNPTQQQLNQTRLRLDTIIKPNPPTHHKLPKLATGGLATADKAWRQHDVSLM